MLIKEENFAGKDGFAALVSAVLVSAAMMIIAAFAVRSAFWARFDFIARENKKASMAAAEGCIHLALLKIGRNESVVPEYCEIVDINGANPYTIIARAKRGDSYTNLKVIAELQNEKIVIDDWREF